MINKLISELVTYAENCGLVEAEDEICITNRLLEMFDVMEYEKVGITEERALADILTDLTEYALEKGILTEDTVTDRDLFDTKIMGILTPLPSAVRARFCEMYTLDPKTATDYYYAFSKATNYIRTDRIEKDEKWVTQTEYGPIDITINLSKPEKDPKDIAKAAQAQKSGYPSCLLCKENEGYAGHVAHPARQNHRIIPVTLAGDNYFLQYSPYVYYNEHCIIFNEEHTPMRIDKAVFEKLLAFVDMFPHYIAGSNADLPIVGGSILSHDHFQGGAYTFAMANAPYENEFVIKGFEDVTAGTIKWPMSVIRLRGKNMQRVAEASDRILTVWRGYTDKEVFIFSHTDETPHNTITPIARMRGDMYEMDLVLRNNITTKDKPWGVYHPAQKYHHIKKENIGLIEVMGLAVLPARLKKEMNLLSEVLLTGGDVRAVSELKKHADWVDEWRGKQMLTEENVHEVIRDEIGKVFAKVLECCGVFKRTEEGQQAFLRFVSEL